MAKGKNSFGKPGTKGASVQKKTRQGSGRNPKPKKGRKAYRGQGR